MLDVHPPHTPTHTWRDFSLHIATICVGLLIAVGIEQTVESIHRQRERADLRESLQHESEQILRDDERVEDAISGEIRWYKQVEVILATAAKERRPIGQLPPDPNKDFDIPDNPVYKSARASNQFDLLSRQESEAYGELNGLLDHGLVAYSFREAGKLVLLQTLHELRFSQNISPSAPLGSYGFLIRGFAVLPGMTLSSEDLRRLYKDTAALEIASEQFLYWCRLSRGAAKVMREGERDLHKIEDAERQFDTLP